MCLCKSELLSVNLGNCGVFTSQCNPGAVVIYHSVSRITVAPQYVQSSAAAAANDPLFQCALWIQSAVSKVIGPARGSKDNNPDRNNICKKCAQPSVTAH